MRRPIHLRKPEGVGKRGVTGCLWCFELLTGSSLFVATSPILTIEPSIRMAKKIDRFFVSSCTVVVGRQ